MRWLTRLITTAILPAARRAHARRSRRALVSTLALALLAVGVALLASAGDTSAASGGHLWSKRFGDASNQLGNSVAVDAGGNVLLTGDFPGSVDFGGGTLTSAGAQDIFLAKFDPAGNHLWSKRFGDADGQEGWSVAVDAGGNVLLTGIFYGSVDFGGGPLTSVGFTDIFLAKFDPAGNHLWSKRFGDADYQYGHSVAVDAGGSVLLTGWFQGSVDFGGGPLMSAGNTDIFLAKFDPAGNHLWSKRFGDADFQYGRSVAVDAGGNVLLTGYFAGSADFGGGPLTSTNFFDIFLAKFDSAGNHLWSRRFGDANLQDGRSVAVDAGGNVLLTGSFLGSVDFGGGPLTSAGGSDVFLAKFDPSGSHLWSKRFGEVNPQTGQSVAVDSTANVLLTGSFSGSVDFGGGPLTTVGNNSDIFAAKFSPAGNHLWSKRFGDGNSQFGESVAVDGAGNVLLTGEFKGQVDFGGGTLTSAAPSYDVFLAKFAGTKAVGGIAKLPGVRAVPVATTSRRSDLNSDAYVTVAAVMIVMLAAASGLRLRCRSRSR